MLLEASDKGKQTILNGGTWTPWIRLFTNRGRLGMALDDDRIVEVFSDAEVTPGQWHRVICSVDSRTGPVELMFDGQPVWSFDLGERYRYNRAVTSVREQERALNFSATGDYDAFVGYVDNLMVFRGGLNQDTMGLLFEALEPAPLATGVGAQSVADNEFSVGMHLGWEANLEGFELQKATTVDGPWFSVEPLQAEFDRHLIVPMLLDGQQAIYRLHRPE